MYRSGPAPTSQRAEVRPIAFMLDNLGSFSDPITLPVRPEDLTRNEGSRATVHQTMGRDIVGWVDNFGELLPSVTISGHTGWKYNQGAGRDGFQEFGALNDMVQHRFHQLKQAAIDAGNDPAGVRLIFIDTLDNFSWSVVPMQFVLRRSKSRPLLFQYNIVLQATETTVDAPSIDLPTTGNTTAAQASLQGAITDISSAQSTLTSLLGGISSLGSMASTIGSFMSLSNQVFGSVSSALSDITNLSNGSASSLINLASGLSQAGNNILRTISSTPGLSSSALAQIAQVASSFNEVSCIFQNALSPGQSYQNYSALLGASGCSSTTGGSAPSPLAGQNVFQLMQSSSMPFNVSGAALQAISSLGNSDPVLAPMLPQEISRNLSSIMQGLTS